MEELLQIQEVKIKEQALAIQTLEENLNRAALYGSELLEEKKHWQRKIERMQCSYRDQLEDLKQENHSLKLQIDNATSLQTNQAAEIELMQEKLNAAQHSVTEKSKEEQHTFKERLRVLKEQLEEQRAKEEHYLSQIQLLERELEDARSIKNTSSPVLDITQTSDEVNRLVLVVEQHELIIEELRISLAIAEGKIQDFQTAENHYKRRIEQLEQNLEAKDCELATASNLLEEKRMEVMELEALAEANKIAQVDPHKRGNSLFGEVEDRRKQVEQQMASLHARHEKALAENAALRAKNTTLKNDIANLMCTATNRDNSAYIQQLELLVQSLRTQASVMAGKLKDKTELPHSLPSSFKDTATSVVDVLLQQAQNRLKAVEEELHKERLYRISQADEVFNASRGRREAEKQVDKFRAENYRLQTKLAELESQLPETGRTEKQPVQAPQERIRFVEKIPSTPPVPLCPITEHCQKPTNDIPLAVKEEKGNSKLPSVITEKPIRSVRIKENVQVLEASSDTFEDRTANEPQSLTNVSQDVKTNRVPNKVTVIKVEPVSSENECKQQ